MHLVVGFTSSIDCTDRYYQNIRLSSASFADGKHICSKIFEESAWPNPLAIEYDSDKLQPDAHIAQVELPKKPFALYPGE
jgi:hypothetical protein